MRVDKLIELREKIGNEPIIPDTEDKLEVIKMLKQPETMEEMQEAARLRTQEDPEYSARYKAPKPRPLRGGGTLAEQAENVRQAGRYGDTELMHVTPEEAKGLSSLRGGVTRNPDTNLPEAFVPLAALGPVIAPTIAGVAATAAPVAAGALATGALAAPAFGFGPATISQAAGFGGGLFNPAAGGLFSFGKAFSTVPGYAQPGVFGNLMNFGKGLWNAYDTANPIIKRAISGAARQPVMDKLLGQETSAESMAGGAIVNMTLGGLSDAAFGGAEETISEAEGAAKDALETGTDESFLSSLLPSKETAALGLGAASILPALLQEGQQPLSLGNLDPAQPFEPADPQTPMKPILVDPETGEDRFTEESIVRRVVEDEGDNTGLGRQLTDPFTDPEEEIEVAEAAGGGGLASLGRGEDNAEYGGEVAHISAEEAELLRRRGGAGTINPDTGLPEYYVQRGSTSAPGSVEHYARYGSWGGPPPGSHGYYAKYGTWGDRSQPNDPSRNPHLLSEDYYGFRGSGDGGGSPVEEEKVYTPFSSKLSNFDVEDRVSRIIGTEDPVLTTPIFVPSGSGTAPTISAAPTGIPAGDSALADLLGRFSAKKDDPIVASVAPVVEGSNRGGLIALAHGGEPLGQNTPVFEGQVPMNGDGMDDEIPYKVIPQDPEDAPDTPDIALLSSDEYVLPADVVSMLGNGSSNAGAAALDRFSKLVRRKAHGTNKQQTELNEDEELANLIR